MKNGLRFFFLCFCFTCSFLVKAQTKINARSFGFHPSATAKKNTLALQLISIYINKLGGGVTLIIDKGIYQVGKETLAKDTTKDYSYKGDTLLRLINCTKPVVIEGNGATIKFSIGLHFGAFHAISGVVYHAKTGGFYNGNYKAYPQNMFEFINNKSITIHNIILDGNIQNMIIGGYWGDTGIQLPGDGIYASNNAEIIVTGVTCRFFPRDGIQIGNHTPTESSPVQKVFFTNSIFQGNARQGLSWVGGNHLVAENCQFTNTGKTINNKTKQTVFSSPSAGIDMEAELGLIRNGAFKNCIIDNNSGAGFLSVGNVANISYIGGKIVGATNWSIYGTGSKALFQNVTVVGSPVNLRMGTGPFDQENAHFNNCLITLDSTLSPTKKVYGNYVMDFGGGAGGFFTACTFDSKNRGTIYGAIDCVFTDCIFKQGVTAAGYNGYSFVRGHFYGTNKWYSPGTPGLEESLKESKIHGSFYINDVRFVGN